MAEYASTPYSTIAVKAIIPAFLYFSGVFIAVHLEAKKTGLKGLSKEHLPKFFQTLFTKGYLLVPLIALVIFILKTTMAMAAIIGTLLAIVVSLFRKETRITPSKFFDALHTPEVVVTAQPKSYAHVDWDLLLEETEGKLSKLRTRLEKAGERPWDEQVDIRDRILELNKELLSVLTQL